MGSVCGCCLAKSGWSMLIAASAVVAALIGLGVAMRPAKGEPPAGGEGAAKPDPYVLGFTMKRIDGTDEDLSKYKGKVVLMVNTASKCGLTPQYEALEKLYESRKEKGLVILGFPANDFLKQEPGSNEEIAKFCTDKYHVTFPMFAKISVKGDDQHPLYKKLTSQPAPIGGDPEWNFAKFVIDRNGNVVARFPAKTGPMDDKVVAKIDELLAASEPKAPEAKPATGN